MQLVLCWIISNWEEIESQKRNRSQKIKAWFFQSGPFLDTSLVVCNVLNTSKTQAPPFLDLQDIRQGAVQREIAIINEGFEIKRDVSREKCITA